MIAFALLLLLFPIASSLSNFPIVQTSYGAVRGYEYRASNGFVGEIFKKIPYAAPPIGPRRWKKPEPPSPWNYTLDGTFFGPACAQVPKIWPGYVTGFSEDCLTLNVYSSKQCRESNASCPVVFYIHGGAMYFSGTNIFADEVMVTNYATQGVILITGSYRLGPFGVMALGDENVLPANLAMHDVLESLRFIRREIHVFGGSKDQITLMGESTGGSLVLALVFSPAVNRPGEVPLFARAIAMSATMSSYKEERQVDISRKVAAKLNCTGTAREVVDCLTRLSTDSITAAALALGGIDLYSETNISGLTLAGELMPVHNMKELRDEQETRAGLLANSTPPTDLLIGTMLKELGTRSEDPTDRRVQALDVLGVRNVEKCTEKYWSDVESGYFDPEYETKSQGIFMSTALFAEAQKRTGAKVFVYQFEYPPHSRHAVDLYYLLGTNNFSMDANEKWLSRVYPVYFTNFIKGLPPAPDWKQLDPTIMNYYSINKSLTDGVTPMMKLGYQQNLYDYYEQMVVFDEQLSTVNKKQFNDIIQMRRLTLLSQSFNRLDILFYMTIICIAVLILVKMYRRWRNHPNTSDEKLPLTD